MVCPYLDYRDGSEEASGDGTTGDGTAFAEPRAFCTVLDEFVQPMRADICNDRYGLQHERHCEIYRGHVGEDE